MGRAKLTTTKPPDSTIPPGERGLTIARLVAVGINGTALASIITGGKSRAQTWDELKAYTNTRTRSGS